VSDMVKAKKIVYNVKTGKMHEEEFEFTPLEEQEPTRIDLKKLEERVSRLEEILDKVVKST